MRRMSPAFAVLDAVAALYLTVWPHELGHSIAAYLLGCKANWWQTDTSPILWGSYGGSIDDACLAAWGGGARAITSLGGIVVNLIFLGLAPAIGAWRGWARDRVPTGWRAVLFMFTLFWALSNFAEAFSYLVINTAWLKSDMKTVVEDSGVNRWVWCTGGAVLAWAFWRPLGRAADVGATMLADPDRRFVWRAVFVGFMVVVATTMVLARVRLT
jgi:hypothetical protein